MSAAGTSQLIKDGMNSGKKSANGTSPFCQTISVVMSPNGLNAPPAFAATTMLMQATETNFGFFSPIAITTAPITSAVVKLSATGEMTEGQAARHPEEGTEGEASVEQPDSRALKTPRSSIVLTKVIATIKNKKISAKSSRLCRNASSAVCVSPVWA